MKNLEFGNKKELEQVLVEYMIDNDEDMNIKYSGLYWRFNIMHKRNKYHVTHAKQDYQFSTIFDLANFMFEKCNFKLDEIETTTKTTVTVDVDVDVKTKTKAKRTRKKQS